MHNDLHTAALILVIAAVTALLRYMPFLLLRKNSKTPPFVSYIGKVLPYSVMGMLVVYCLTDVDFSSAASLVPTLTAVILTAVLQLLKHNILLSIAGGTACYMLLIKCVF